MTEAEKEFKETLAALHINEGTVETPEDLQKAMESPILWAEAFLKNPINNKPIKCNYVQRRILGSKSMRIVARVHRRSGKSFGIAMDLLHGCFTTPMLQCLVICPDKPKVDVVFTAIRNFVQTNKALSACMVRNSVNPAEMAFSNGSVIKGFTTATRSGGKGDNIRGQTADRVVLDEVSYFEEEDYQAFMPIIVGDESRSGLIKTIAVSTTKGNRGRFYDWDTDPDSDWDSIWIPITENPDVSESYKEDARKTHTEMEWIFEWLCEWGEIEGGVVNPIYLDESLSEYVYDERAVSGFPKAIGVDWDKFKHGCEMVVVELRDGMYKVLHRQEVPKSEFTHTKAVQKVIQLNEAFNPEVIMIDRGCGESNYETLILHGRTHPDTGLAQKVIGVTFDQAVESYDSGSKIRKRLKEVMVNTWVKLFEDGRMCLTSRDDLLYRQLKNYHVKRFTQSHVIYTDKDEHAVDAFGLAVYALHSKYGYGTPEARPKLTPHFIEMTEKKPRKDYKKVASKTYLDAFLRDEEPLLPTFSSARGFGSTLPGRAKI